MALAIKGLSSDHTPEAEIILRAGPSRTHIFDENAMEDFQNANQQDHRGKWAADLLKATSQGVFEILGIPLELQNPEFDAKNPSVNKGWHVAYTNSGTDGMGRAIRAACFEANTLLVNTDEFSSVAANEMTAMGRQFVELKFERGKALNPGSEAFEKIAEFVRKSEVRTVYLTRNGTTTGTDQKDAIEELIRIRDESGSSTIIVADEVSAQWYAAERKKYPDIFFTTGQKDSAIGPGTGVIVFNNRALERESEVRKARLDTGGKLGIGAAYVTNDKRMAKEGQTAQTPPLGLILMQRLLQENILHQGGRNHIAIMQASSLRAIIEAVTIGELEPLGVKMLTQDPKIQSKTSHVLTMPAGVKGKEVVKKLKEEHSIEISTGYGKFADAEVRICPYSAAELNEVEETLEKMADIIRTMRTI